MFVSLMLCCLIIIPRVVLPQANYCSIPCDHIPHVVCGRQWKCGPVTKKCKPYPSTEKFRQDITDAHNRIRTLIANGDDTLGKLPIPGNMNMLTYDTELEYIAMCWATLCYRGISPCSNTRAFDLGQLIWEGPHLVNSSDEVFNLLHESYLQKRYVNETVIRKYHMHYEQESGTFTQIIWGETKLLGCYRVKDKWHVHRMFCNYAPEGNVDGSRVYSIADQPCSSCGRYLKCSKTFRGLCGIDIGVPSSSPSHLWFFLYLLLISFNL